MSDNRSFKFIDLFCGIGGFHQALKNLGGECVFASDIDKECRKVYKTNYGIEPTGDITQVNIDDIPEFDILTGGFPCQSFSNSGKKKGLTDKRGQLYENIIEIAKKKRPKFMFLENVKHIKKIDHGNVFNHILKCIGNIGYNVNTYDISPHQLGVPQQRERVIFVCISNDIYNNNITLDMTPPNCSINFEDILDDNPDAKYNISTEVENILTVWDEMVNHIDVGDKLSPTILCKEFNKEYNDEEFNKLQNWKQDYIKKNQPIYNKYKSKWDEWYDTNKELLNKKEIYSKLEWQVGIKKENDSIFNYFIQLRQSGIRVKKTNYFPTLVAIVQTPIYAKEKRYITPRECARLQSFPDTFILHESDNIAYKQFGNAVNVKVINFVCNKVLHAYNII